MRTAIIISVLLCVSAPIASATAVRSAPRPYTDFLNELIDVRRVALLPQPGETCRQFSSYDRASHDKSNWGANNDRGHFLREDVGGSVLAEMQGPGVVQRIWSANPAGWIRIFIDGARQPVVSMDFKEFFSGKKYPFVAPLVGFRARGANCYVPIPYQQSCKIVVDNPGELYYHVTYRTLPEGTRVEPFHLPLTPEEKGYFDAVCARLEHCDQFPVNVGATKTAGRWIDVPPGQTAVLAKLNGPAAVYELRARLMSGNKRRALRDAVLRITWDGHSTPSVLCPLGDFFGTSPGVNLYTSLPLGMTDDGYYSHWVMPFARSALVELVNEGTQPVSLAYRLVYGPIQWTGTLGYFHAKWRFDAPCTTFDWPLLETKGRGRYCGAMLTVWNPSEGWWGEGDEKMWVDGENFPSTFGTGSEDYFGYAWCDTTLFTNCYHDQTLCEGPGNGNYTSVNRFQIADNVPFQESIKVTIENYAKDKDYAATVYWYADLAQKDTFEPVPEKDRVPRPPRGGKELKSVREN